MIDRATRHSLSCKQGRESRSRHLNHKPLKTRHLYVTPSHLQTCTRRCRTLAVAALPTSHPAPAPKQSCSACVRGLGSSVSELSLLSCCHNSFRVTVKSTLHLASRTDQLAGRKQPPVADTEPCLYPIPSSRTLYRYAAEPTYIPICPRKRQC